MEWEKSFWIFPMLKTFAAFFEEMQFSKTTG